MEKIIQKNSNELLVTSTLFISLFMAFYLVDWHYLTQLYTQFCQGVTIGEARLTGIYG